MASASLPEKKQQEIRDLYAQCGNKARVAAELGVDRGVVAKYVRGMNLPPRDPAPEEVAAKIIAKYETPEAEPDPATLEDQVIEDREQLRASFEKGDLKSKYKFALQQLQEAEARLEAVLQITQPVKPFKIAANPRLDGGQATVIVQASDWHVGERVDADTVNNLNEYNPDIAQARGSLFFQNTLRLVRNFRKDVAIEHLVLWLGGDLITGYIHDELEESNYLSPTEESIFAKRLIMGGLKLWKESGDFKQITVVTSYGNHGRIGHKKRISTGHKNSYEWMMYKDLEGFYAEDEVIKFQVGNGYFNYLDIYDKTCRFHHGDNVKYQGGVGGVLVPLNKFIQRSNSQRRADADFIGHLHQRIPLNMVYGSAINSSLIGFNAYALSLGASPEPPTQNLQLVDSKRGFTIAAPIIVTSE
jgi:hypothetical protein